jgi:hypothetical protein
MEQMHLLRCILFADFGHGKTDVDQYPIAGDGHIVLQKAHIHFPAYTRHLYGSQVRLAKNHFNDPAWNR